MEEESWRRRTLVNVFLQHEEASPQNERENLFIQTQKINT